MKQEKLISLTMFDLLKGCCMLTVILLHCIWGVGTDRLVMRPLYSVLMPLFFIMSGYWMKKKRASEGIRSACLYLLKPYGVVMAVIVGIGGVHRFFTHNLENWLDQFLLPAVLVSSDGTRIGPMWFVFCLFLCWCLYYWVVNYLKEEKAQIVFSLALGALGGFVLPLRLPFQIGQTMLAFPLFYFGYWLKRHKILEKKLHWRMAALLLLVWAISVYYGAIDFSVYLVKYGIFSIVGGACGSFLLIYIFLRLNRFECTVFDWLRRVGRYTMPILCIHSIEKAVVPWEIIFRYWERDTWQGVIVWFILRLFLIGLCCRLLTVCISLKQR